MEEDRGKKFNFPENVDSGFNVVKGISQKQLFSILIPCVLLVLMIMIIPPYTIILFLIKIMIGIFVIFTGLAFIIIKPVGNRENISLTDFLKIRKSYIKRQKTFIKRPKQRR